MHLPAVLRALRSRSGLRRVLLAYALFGLVDLGTWFAIILFAFARGGPKLAGLVAVCEVLPAAFIAPLLAGIAEKLPRGTALIAGYSTIAIISAIQMAALAMDAPLVVIVVIASLLCIAIAVVRPIHFVALPQLARSPEDLVSANALSTIADGWALFAGPIIAGWLTQTTGSWAVFALATVTAAAAAAVCLNLGLVRPSAEEVEEEEVPEWRAALDGLIMISRDWAALALLVIMATRFVVAGASDVLGVTFSEDVLGLGESGAGIMLAGLGIGALVGGAMSASFAVRRNLAPSVGLSGTLVGLALAVVMFVVVLPPAMALLAVVGLAGSLLMVSGRTLLQRTNDDRVLARVFAVQEGVALLGVAVGAALAPAIVEWLHPAGAFGFFGIAIALFVAAGFLLVRKLDARAVYLPKEIELLRLVPFLSVIPSYELERLAKNAEWIDVSPRVDVIRQGDPGDRFYVIESGEFEVTVDGARRPDLVERGQGFGEIALLYAIPRTATVTSRTSARLLSLSGDDFLAAVTGNADGRAIADEVTRAHLLRDENVTAARKSSPDRDSSRP
ncbi:MAG: MFS transporter, partial [Actinomycetes bacterium]